MSLHVTERPIRALACVLAIGACFGSAHAAQIFVDDDAPNDPGPGDREISDPGEDGSPEHPFDAIQEAIDAAKDSDEIIVAAGTYVETINLLGKAIELSSADGAAATTIDGGGAGSVITCTSGEVNSTVIEGFTITGGTGTGAPGATAGGGMNIVTASPTVRDCTFTDNTAFTGAGISNRTNANPLIENCVFDDNDVAGTLAAGGGMRNRESNPTVRNCTFVSNSAARGGGMYNEFASDPLIVNSVFLNNSASNLGGGIFNDSGSSPSIRNSSIASNFGMFNGGGVMNLEASCTLLNTILWGNIAPVSTTEAQVAQSGSGSIIASFCNVQGGLAGFGNISANPQFVSLGGGNLQLSSSSPCIDAANNNSVPAGVIVDHAGLPRFVDDPATADTGFGAAPIVDMGAFEFQTGPPPPNGACCLSDGSCESVTEAECLQLLSGEYQGDFTECDDAECAVACPEDLDGSGEVAFADLLALLSEWGPCNADCPEDFDGSGDVGFSDLLQVLVAWGPCS